MVSRIEAFNTGTGCTVPRSGGWCVATDSCVGACQLSESTSAQLRRVEQELTEARAAVTDVEKHRKLTAERLTRVEQERDEAVTTSGELAMELVAANARLARAEQERDHARAQLDDAITQHAHERAQAAGLAAYMHAACEKCEQYIKEGEPFQRVPGTGGLTEHITCPEKEETRA